MSEIRYIFCYTKTPNKSIKYTASHTSAYPLDKTLASWLKPQFKILIINDLYKKEVVIIKKISRNLIDIFSLYNLQVFFLITI